MTSLRTHVHANVASNNLCLATLFGLYTLPLLSHLVFKKPEFRQNLTNPTAPKSPGSLRCLACRLRQPQPFTCLQPKPCSHLGPFLAPSPLPAPPGPVLMHKSHTRRKNHRPRYTNALHTSGATGFFFKEGAAMGRQGGRAISTARGGFGVGIVIAHPFL